MHVRQSFDRGRVYPTPYHAMQADGADPPADSRPKRGLADAHAAPSCFSFSLTAW